MLRSSLIVGLLGLVAACGSPPSNQAPVRAAAAAPSPRPCFTIRGNSEIGFKDATKVLADLSADIRLLPEDQALKEPKSLDDVKKILRRDLVYWFENAAAFSRAQNSVEGRFSEATVEMLLGESQLIASQILNTQEAWLGGDLRVARANLAGEGKEPSSERGRMLAQLIRAVEEGNKVAYALGVVAPAHLARGAEVIRQLRTDAPADPRTHALVAEYHRLRGEWPEFEVAMKAAEEGEPRSALCYLRAMEQLERYRRPDQGATLLRECLTKYPRFVRAEAGLVLMATTPSDSLRELDKLKRMNPDHYLVMLLEPTLAADQELGRMQKDGGRAPR